MTADPRDLTVEGRLALIADNLETRTGSDPGARRRDWTIPAILKRINDSISGGAFEAHLLGDHTDVGVSGASDGDFLRYNASSGEWEDQTAEISDMTDVAATPVSGEFLRGDGANWVNEALILGDLPAIALDDLSDVVIPAVGSGDFLRYDGGDWVNATLILADLPAIALDDLSDATITGAATRDVLTVVGGTWVDTPKEDFIWAAGDIPLTADWDAGDFKILMEQIHIGWAKNNTAENPAIFVMTADDTADHNKSLVFIDVNYDYNNAGGVLLAEIAAINVDMDMTLTAAIASAPKFRIFKGDLNYGAHNPIDAAFEVTVTGTGATALFGGSMAHFRWNNSAVSGVALKAEVYGSSASAAASNIIVGITGFAGGADSYTGMIIGFRGVCDNTNSASGAIAVHGRPAATVTTLAKDKMVALGGFEGHLFLNGGSGAFIDTTAGSFDTPNIISPTHLDFVNNTGELYVEHNVEIDGTLYLDNATLAFEALGDCKIAADSKKLFFGADDDASLYYDATDLVINPKVVGSGIVSILGNLEFITISAGAWQGSVIAEAYLPNAGLTVEGVVELATTAEIEIGTDSARVMPIDQFVASDRNIRFINIRVVEAGTDVAADTTVGGDFEVPFTGTILQRDADKSYFCAFTDTAGITGTMVVDVHLNGTTIMDTNKLDIETTEKSTKDATTQPDLTTTAVTAGDVITIDIDAIHSGTAAKGLTVRIPIRLT